MDYSVTLVLIFTLSILLSSSLLDFSTYGLTDLQSQQGQQLTKYVDPIGRFTINYPASWIISPLPEIYKLDENIQEDIAAEFKFEGDEGWWKSFNLLIKQLTDDEPKELRALSDYTIAHTIPRLPEGQIEEPTECERYKVQGNKACSFIISMKLDPIIDQKGIIMQVTTLLNGTAYFFSYGNTPGDFDKDLPMIEQMIASFRLT